MDRPQAPLLPGNPETSLNDVDENRAERIQFLGLGIAVITGLLAVILGFTALSYIFIGPGRLF